MLEVQDDSWVEAMAAEMVDRKEAGGYELALKWLCAIFAATSEPPPAAAAEPSGARDGRISRRGRRFFDSRVPPGSFQKLGLRGQALPERVTGIHQCQ